MVRCPCFSTGVHVTVTQEQFRQAVAGGHQIDPGVLPRAHQVASRFLGDRGDTHADDLVHAEQPGQQQGILGVGLDPVTRWTHDLRRRRHLAADPCGDERPVQPIAGRARLVAGRHRAGQFPDPLQHHLMRRDQPRRLRLARVGIDRGRDHAPRMHVQPNTRTLCKHRGLLTTVDRPNQGPPSFGNPRTCAREAPARNPSHKRSCSYRLSRRGRG